MLYDCLIKTKHFAKEKEEAAEMEDEKQEKVEATSRPKLLGNWTSDDTMMLGQQAKEEPVYELAKEVMGSEGTLRFEE